VQIKSCYVTKTRLMGVVAGYISYCIDDENFVEFYHIEFEEYGIDRFDQLVNPSDFMVKQLRLEVFGGLGGPLISVEAKVLAQLLIAGKAVDPTSLEYLTAMKQSKWLQGISNFDGETFKKAIELVCEELRSPYELIHYFLMRFLGQDAIYLRYTLLNRAFLKKRYSLMRNEIDRLGDEGERYRFSALVLQDVYEVIEGEVELCEGLVADMTIKAQVEVSDLEAALMLKKKEYIYLYDVDNPEVENLLTLEHKYLSPTLYKNGRLYTGYRSHNDHVNANVFYLNGDVEVLFYFTDSEQLLLASDDLRAMIKWDDWLSNRFGEDLDKYEEWDFESPILYDFITSEFVDFDDFLSTI